MKRLFCLFLAMIFCLALCSCDTRYHGDDNEDKTSSAADPTKGHWELVGKKTDPNKDIITEHSKTLFTVDQTSHIIDYSYDDEEDVMNGTHFKGSYEITCNDLPKSYKVGDTISFTVKAEVHSVTNKTQVQGFEGYAKFETNIPDEVFTKGNIGRVCAGFNKRTYPSPFCDSQENTYEKVLEKRHAGKLKHFDVILITEAGYSFWKYKWVADK